MKQNKIIAFLILILFLVFLFFIFNEKPFLEEVNIEQQVVITDENLIEALKTNETGKDFLEKYEEFVIQKRDLLSKEEIEQRKVQGNYIELFEPLLLEDNKYAEIRVVAKQGGRGIVGTIDLETNKAMVVHWLFLIEMK